MHAVCGGIFTRQFVIREIADFNSYRFGYRYHQNAKLLGGSADNVLENVVVFGFDANSFKMTPVPGRVQVREDSSCASQHSHLPVLLKPIFSALEAEPMATRHVRPINRKTQVVGRVPSANCLYDVPH